MYDFLLRALTIWRGNPWNQAAKALVFFGIISINGILQYIIPAVASRLGFPGIVIPETPTWLSLTLIGLGILLFVLQRIIPDWVGGSNPNPHDLQLIKKFRSLITSKLLDFLRNHSFGTPWHRDALNPVYEFAEVWKGAHYEFQDKELDRELTAAKKEADKLADLEANGAWSLHQNPMMRTAKTDEDYQIGTQPSTVAKIKRMNEQAKSFVDAVNKLEKLAQQKLP